MINGSGKPNSTGSRLSISNIGMSVIGISLEELLAHEDSAVQKITQFQGTNSQFSCFQWERIKSSCKYS